MMFALNSDGARELAWPGGRATCPSCGGAVIAKCGDIVVNHWAHEVGVDCDPWSDGESQWHLRWKQYALQMGCSIEVVMGGHRADIVTPRGTVIELQHTSLPASSVHERELFYKSMAWIYDAMEFRCNLVMRDRGGFHSFRWKHPRKSHWYVRAPLFWDMGGGQVFEPRKIHASVPCGGWGVYHAGFPWSAYGLPWQGEAARHA